MKTRNLARVIERDLLSEPKEKPDFPKCHGCGRSYLRQGPPADSDDSSRFCSRRCRQAYDAGIPTHDPDYAGKSNPRWYSLQMGTHGFLIDCTGCGKRFDSTGLRCCSTACERTYRERQEIDRLLADVSFRAARRKCEECGGDIPNWRNGRKVSTRTKFCSEACQAKAARKRRKGCTSSRTVLSVEM